MTDAEVAELKKLQATFNEEVGKSLDKRDTDLLTKLEKKIDEANAKLQADIDARLKTFSVPGSQDATHRGKKFSFTRAMASIAANDPSIAPLEWEMHHELKKQSKAMGLSPDTAGGFLVPNEVAQDQLIPLLYAKSVVADLGATKLDGLTRSPFQIPRVSGGTTGYWVAEAGSITASDLTTAMLSMSPHGLAALTLVSDLLQQLDNTAVENMIKNDQATQLALQLDLKALRGTGASNTPIGVINASGVNTSSVSSTPTYDELVDAVGAVQEDNALEGNLGWAIAFADLQLIRKMKDVTGGTDNKSNIQPLGTRSLLTGVAPDERLLGYKCRMSTQLTTGDIVFGNWADMIIANWGGVRLDMTNALGFATAQTHIRTLTYADVGIRHAVSFNVG